MKLIKLRHISYLILITLFFSGFSANGQNKRRQTQPVGKPNSQISLTPRQIAEKVSKSVVLIVTQDADGEPLAQGSGFFYSVPTSANKSNGQFVNGKTNLVATNLHVFKRAWQGYIKTLNDGATYKIKQIVGIDLLRDLCVLEIQGISGLPLMLGNSDQIAVGDDIYAAGNPKGLEGSFSKGIVSSIRQKLGLIQIDAAISSGSSGGAVVNNRGEVIGVAVSSLSSGQNLNFAIPSNYLAQLPLTWQTSVNATGALAITDKENERLVGAVRSVTTKEAEFNTDDSPPSELPAQITEQRIFNEFGAQTKSVLYNADGSISLEIMVEYDERGMRSSADIFMPGRGRKKKTFSDQENLDLKLKVRYYSITKEDEYDAQGGAKVKRAITYDRDGNEIEEVRRASEGTVIKIVTKYDEESKMLGKLEYRNGALWVTSKYTYKFDGYGNWVKRTELITPAEDIGIKDEPIKVIYREITYF